MVPVLDDESDDMSMPNDTTSAPGDRRRIARRRLPRALAVAYRRAVYVVDSPEGELHFAVGRASPRLDRLLAELGVARAAFLTAANPGSHRLPEEENAARTARLRERLAAAGFRVLDGESRDRGGDWREPSFLVPGIDPNAALALARELGQAAFVRLEAGRPPALVVS